MKKYFFQVFIVASCNLAISQCFTTISSGHYHNAAMKPDGSIWIWGAGSWGQLNNGTEGTDEYVPVIMAANANWHTITAGSHNTFIIKNNGTLWGTGINLYGQLGIGSTSNNSYNLLQIGTATNWKQITSNFSFTLALKTDNTIWAWGQNDGYQTGNNVCCANQLTPIQVGTANDWKTIAASNNRSGFAIKNNGTLWGWGTNIASLLGDSDVSVRTTPTQLNADSDWDKLFLGTAHGLAIKTNSTLWAWGGNGNGELAQPTTTNTSSTLLNIPGNWKTASAGAKYSMGIKTDGTLWGWGKNDFSQIGNGSTGEINYTPIQIGTATNWDSVSCGYYHTIALRTDGSLWSWGLNDNGQLGNGTATSVATPENVVIAGCTLNSNEFAVKNVFTISTNTTYNELSLQYHGLETISDIAIYDITGKEVFTTQALGNTAFMTTFSIATLQNGSYIIALKNGAKIVMSKMFVK